ncbi:DUF6144 family protein [Lachnoclostridium phytofermentans]|uniref:Metanogen output domain-containing protein n=1 Tax=Lachnoclostridium phytofermentans (strain ATCC 700394 / DSM 18823 / ISDg) TaxID=357809 RepID=A9KRA3_LACP7|nr:DUF6144 family protein [Lachnoclostridium phytofermentans]ABX40571.1 hypothetical protein Cphy_0184 [Lachnoclostridium phytofermentans ISDg]
MGEIVNTRVKRLYDSIEKHVGKEKADTLLTKITLPKSASPQKRFEWACNVCTLLEENFDEDTICEIRMDCCCKPSMLHMKKLKELYSKSESLPGYANLASNETPAKFWAEGSVLYMSYPECYCSDVKHTKGTMSKTWCLCTLGYTKYMYEYIFGCAVKVELLESVKLGNNRCVIRIESEEKPV